MDIFFSHGVHLSYNQWRNTLGYDIYVCHINLQHNISYFDGLCCLFFIQKTLIEGNFTPIGQIDKDVLKMLDVAGVASIEKSFSRSAIAFNIHAGEKRRILKRLNADYPV